MATYGFCLPAATLEEVLVSRTRTLTCRVFCDLLAYHGIRRLSLLAVGLIHCILEENQEWVADSIHETVDGSLTTCEKF